MAPTSTLVSPTTPREGRQDLAAVEGERGVAHGELRRREFGYGRVAVDLRDRPAAGERAVALGLLLGVGEGELGLFQRDGLGVVVEPGEDRAGRDLFAGAEGDLLDHAGRAREHHDRLVGLGGPDGGDAVVGLLDRGGGRDDLDRSGRTPAALTTTLAAARLLAACRSLPARAGPALGGGIARRGLGALRQEGPGGNRPFGKAEPDKGRPRRGIDRAPGDDAAGGEDEDEQGLFPRGHRTCRSGLVRAGGIRRPPVHGSAEYRVGRSRKVR